MDAASIPSPLNFFARWRQQGVEKLKADDQAAGVCCVADWTVGSVAAITLFVLGCLGAAGIMPGTALGACAIGLGIGAYALSLPSLRNKALTQQFVIGGLATVAILTVGALGMAGILSTQIIGWTIIAAIGGKTALRICVTYFDPAKRKRAKEEGEKARAQFAEAREHIVEAGGHIRSAYNQ